MAAAVLSLAGFFVSLYLYLYKIGMIGTLACGSGGCETVQMSPYSRFMGLEVALYGVLGYLALLVVSLETVRQPADRRRLTLLLGLSGIGLAFTVYLTSLELFVIHAICRWCVGSAVIITLLFLAVLLEWRRETPSSTPADIPASQ